MSFCQTSLCGLHLLSTRSPPTISPRVVLMQAHSSSAPLGSQDASQPLKQTGRTARGPGRQWLGTSLWRTTVKGDCSCRADLVSDKTVPEFLVIHCSDGLPQPGLYMPLCVCQCGVQRSLKTYYSQGHVSKDNTDTERH